MVYLEDGQIADIRVGEEFSKNVFLDTDFSNHPVPLSKEGSTFSPSPSSSGSGDVTAPSRCSEPLRYKVGGASKPSPNCAGWDRKDAIGDTTSTALDVVQKELKYLGLWKFAGAVMYVLHITTKL